MEEVAVVMEGGDEVRPQGGGEASDPHRLYSTSRLL